jgi:hypothetical protein
MSVLLFSTAEFRFMPSTTNLSAQKSRAFDGAAFGKRIVFRPKISGWAGLV